MHWFASADEGAVDVREQASGGTAFSLLCGERSRPRWSLHVQVFKKLPTDFLRGRYRLMCPLPVCSMASLSASLPASGGVTLFHSPYSPV